MRLQWPLPTNCYTKSHTSGQCLHCHHRGASDVLFTSFSHFFVCGSLCDTEIFHGTPPPFLSLKHSHGKKQRKGGAMWIVDSFVHFQTNKIATELHCRFSHLINSLFLGVNFSVWRMSLFWWTHQFEIWYNGRQLPSASNFCHTVITQIQIHTGKWMTAVAVF